MGRSKRKFTEAQKRAAVDDYVSGRKSAAQVAAAFEVSAGQVYKWRVQLDETTKNAQIAEMENMDPRDLVKALAEMQAERDAYRTSLGESHLIVELLKKRLRSTSSQQRSVLTGLIETLEESVRKRKPGK